MSRSVLFALLCAASLVLAACGGHHNRYGMERHGGGEYGTDRAQKEMDGLVDRTVQDPNKAAQVKSLVREIVAEVRQSYARNRDYHQQLYELNARYEAAPEAFMKVLDELNHSRMRTAGTILKLRFKMKELMTPEEWKALTDAMNRYRDDYRHDGSSSRHGRM